MGCSSLPPVAVTCGEPSGIGPEIIASAWEALRREIPLFVIGDPAHLPGARSIDHPSDAAGAGSLPVLPHAFAGAATPGMPAPSNAKGVVEVIERAVALAMDGQASAICTAPISKQVLVKHAGFAFPGHTEFLASLSGAEHPVMMLAAEELRVVPATIHIPLSQVPDDLSSESLEATIRVTAAALERDFGIRSPRLAIAGLNPHAGEGGVIGTEDDRIIAPVCDKLRADGYEILGPLPADTMFHEAARAKYDAAIAMYHDQALIPIKTLAFDRGVNVTLGLPFVRTSPDHGTAFDIAGQGIANPTSMIAALRLAWHLANTRARAA